MLCCYFCAVVFKNTLKFLFRDNKVYLTLPYLTLLLSSPPSPPLLLPIPLPVLLLPLCFFSSVCVRSTAPRQEARQPRPRQMRNINERVVHGWSQSNPLPLPSPSQLLSCPSPPCLHPPNRLVGLVVKAPVSRTEDPVFESRLRGGFFRVESYR